jgi:predicted nucleic-acid-binding protein
VEKWFLEAKKGRLRLVVCTEILLEINYVLLRPLRLSKVQTVASLKSIVKLSFLEFEDKEPFLMALKIYERENMDLVDCFLFSKATMEDGEVLSFDKDYSRLGK